MKHLANIISFTRILLSLSLFFFLNNKVAYIIIFAIASFSDFIDGTIARKTNSQSKLGEALDDYGDIALAAVAITSLAIWLKREALVFIPFLIVVVILKVANAIITKNKFGRAAILHTILAKITFTFVFITPIVYLLADSTILIFISFSLAILTAIEEGIIHLTSDSYDPNRKSIFQKKKAIVEVNEVAETEAVQNEDIADDDVDN